MDYLIKRYKYEGIILEFGLKQARKSKNYFYLVNIDACGYTQNKMYASRRQARKIFNANCKILADHIREQKKLKGGTNA